MTLPRSSVTFLAIARTATIALLLVICSGPRARAQDAAPAGDAADTPTKSFFMARTGESLGEPYVAKIHYLEFFQVRGKWIVPDVGYVDFGHGNYREFFIGGGRTLYESRYASWDQELLYVQAAGSAAGSAKYLQPWSMLRVHFTPKFSNETVYFAYLPLNTAAGIHQVLERCKFEYAVKKHWKIGAGYAGGYVPGGPWLNKPLVTTTVSTKAGAFEVWLQKIPGGAQVELRYALFHTSY
jgi:hypothetical protein